MFELRLFQQPDLNSKLSTGTSQSLFVLEACRLIVHARASHVAHDAHCHLDPGTTACSYISYSSAIEADGSPAKESLDFSANRHICKGTWQNAIPKRGTH